MPLSKTISAKNRSRTVCLPTKPLVCSKDPNYLYIQDGYECDYAMSEEMDCIAMFIFRFAVTYLQAIDLFGSNDRVLRTPAGSRQNSGGTIYDLFVPLRALRHWASHYDNENAWRSLNIQHVFPQQLWMGILRLVSMVYDQEYRLDPSAWDTIFLSNEGIFGPAWRNKNNSIQILYNMFRICQYAVGDETFSSFKYQHERNDSDPVRLENLTRAHVRRIEDDGYNVESDVTFIHLLPLHPAGRPRMNNDRETHEGMHTVTIKAYDPAPYKRFVYCRGMSIVELNISEEFPTYLEMTTKPIPQSFLDEFDVDMPAPMEGYIDEMNTRYYMLNQVIRDVNAGNYYPAEWLFSQVLNGRLVATRGPYSSWFKYEEDDAQGITEPLYLNSICDVIGPPLLTNNGDIILPVSSDGQWCYLTKTRRGQDYYAEWGDARSEKVVAQDYPMFNQQSKLLSQ